MRCPCGNEQGKPIVSPSRLFAPPEKKGDTPLPVLYMGGMNVADPEQHLCWFCSHPVLA